MFISLSEITIITVFQDKVVTVQYVTNLKPYKNI